VLYKIVNLVFPLRADEQDEWSGMDASESGERGYIHTDMESGGAGTISA
jgi:Amt family ammonium transporter